MQCYLVIGGKFGKKTFNHFKILYLILKYEIVTFCKAYSGKKISCHNAAISSLHTKNDMYLILEHIIKFWISCTTISCGNPIEIEMGKQLCIYSKFLVIISCGSNFPPYINPKIGELPNIFILCKNLNYSNIIYNI